MPASAILHVSADVQCFHPLSTTQAQGSSSRVKVGGIQVTTVKHGWTVMKCALSEVPQTPCASGKFTTGAARVKVEGDTVATLSSTGTCDPTNQPLLAKQTQTRVLAE